MRTRPNHESLVKHESQCDSTLGESEALTSCDLSNSDDYVNLNAYDDSVTYTESLEVDVIYSAPPLQELYRYHVYFSHSPEDQFWVQDLVTKLESEPYNYKCCYTNGNNKSKNGFLQNALCAAMLSERVVVVLTRHYVKDTWFGFQDVIQNLTQCSLYRQRMLAVLLRDCTIPEPLSALGFLDAREHDFFRCFIQHLRSDRLPRSSESFSSEMSCMLYSPANIENGQLLTSVKINIAGRWKAMLFAEDDDDVPTPLCCHGISMSYGEFVDILQTVSHVTDDDRAFEFLFSMRPVMLLVIALGLWLTAFIFVLIYLMDESKQSALGIRLTVFSLPLLFVLYGYLVRWKRQRCKDKIERKMLLVCARLNERLYQSERPVLLTSSLSRKGDFNLHFVYFCAFDCVGDVDLMLNTYMEEDAEKFATLIELYTRNKDYLIQGTMAERLTIMMSSAYLHDMLLKLLPRSSQERHTNFNFCLCQFLELFLEELFQCLAKKTIVHDLQQMFLQRLNFAISRTELNRVRSKLAINEEFSFVSV